MSIPVQAIGVRQRKVEYLHFHVDISELGSDSAVNSTAGVLEGTYHLTDALSEATGVSTLTLKKAGRRDIHIVGCHAVSSNAHSTTETVDARFSFAVTASTIVVTSEVSGTNTAVDYSLTVAVFGTASQQ